jgi:SAM-dependent methyltransferase
MTKKMVFIPSADSKFKPAPTHLYSLEYSRKFIEGKKVLDVGCWNGDFETLLKNTKCSLTGIDPEEEALKVAIKRNPRFKFIKADVLKKLPLGKEFDTSLMWMTIEHIPNHTSALKNINRVMKKGGHIFISTPSNNLLSIIFDLPYFVFGHQHFNPSTLHKFLKDAGFEVEESRVIGGFFVALRISLLLFYKHLLGRSLPPMPYIERRQLAEYRSGKGFNEVFIRARKVKDV